MKQNILFLIHVEEMFRRLFPDKLYPLRLRKACLSKKYNRVYIFVSDVDEPIPEIAEVTNNSQWVS